MSSTKDQVMFEPPASPCSLVSDEHGVNPSHDFTASADITRKKSPRGVSLDCILPDGAKRARRKKILDIICDDAPLGSRSPIRKKSKRSPQRRKSMANGDSRKLDMMFVEAEGTDLNSGFVNQLNTSAADERRKLLLQKLRMIDAKKAKLASQQTKVTKHVKTQSEPVTGTRIPVVPSLNTSAIARHDSSQDAARIGARLRGFADSQHNVLDSSSPVPSETSQDGLRRRASRSRTPSVLLSRFPGEVSGVYKPPGVSQCKRLSFCKRLVNELLRNPAARPFSAPVNELWPQESIPRYFDVIVRPMDLGTIKRKLETGDYLRREKSLAPEELLNVAPFEEDVKQVFRNAMIYNSAHDALYNSAKVLLGDFEREMKQLPAIDRRSARKIIKKKTKITTRKVSSPRTPRRQKNKSPKTKRSPKSNSPKSMSVVATSPMTPQLPVPAGMDLRELKAHIDELRTMRGYLEMAMTSPTTSSTSPKGRKHVALLYAMEMTPEEKAELTENIARLPVEKVDKLVSIIRNSGQHGLAGGQQEGELELDIDKFDNKLLRDLELYVESVLDLETKEKKEPETTLHYETVEEVDAAIAAAEKKIAELRNSKPTHKKEKSFYDMDDDSSSDSAPEQDCESDSSDSESDSDSE